MIIVIEPPPLHLQETIIIRVNKDNSKSIFYISLFKKQPGPALFMSLMAPSIVA